MRPITRAITILLILSFSSIHAAKYAGEAFSLGVGGRGLALGGAVIAGPFDATAAYWNPAGLNQLSGRYIVAMHAETFGSLLNHDFVAFADSRPETNSLIRAYSFYFYYLGGGGIKITDIDALGRPFVVREESHGDYLLSSALAGKLSPKLDFGLTGKIIIRDIGTETGYGLTVDGGLLYYPSSLVNLGLMVTDLTSGFIRYSGATFNEGAGYESINPTVKPAVLFEKTIQKWSGRFALSGDIKFENLRTVSQYWSGAVSLDTHYGLEIGYQELLFVRGGFDIGRITAGGGVDVRNFTVDFAYLNHSELDESFRVSAGYRW